MKECNVHSMHTSKRLRDKSSCVARPGEGNSSARQHFGKALVFRPHQLALPPMAHHTNLCSIHIRLFRLPQTHFGFPTSVPLITSFPLPTFIQTSILLFTVLTEHMLCIRNVARWLDRGWGDYPGNRHGQEHDGLVERQFIVSVEDQNTQRALVHRGWVFDPDSESQTERVVNVVYELTS